MEKIKEEIKFSKKQEEFLELAIDGKSISLDGKAGSGKSFITRYVKAKLEEMGRRVVALAPTGVAANNIGGQTIHSFFSINPFGVANYDDCKFMKSEKKRLVHLIDTIIIDEKSMLRPDILDAIHWTLLKNGVKNGLKSKQVIFVGDMKQLPPVLDDNTRSVLFRDYKGEGYFNAKVYGELGVIEIELDEILRQSNEEFIEALNLVREGVTAPYFRRFFDKGQKGIVLAPHNATVLEYNNKGLEEIKDQKLVKFVAYINGNVKADDFNLESEILVKHGAKIMYLANSRNNPLVNGTIGEFVVKELDGEDMYFIKVGHEEYAINLMEFTKKEYVLNRQSEKLEMTTLGSIKQMPIKLAYALSIHKSQGLTLPEITVDLTRPCFQNGQLYVALSRVTGPEGLSIIM